MARRHLVKPISWAGSSLLLALRRLSDLSVPPAAYGQAMHHLGAGLGDLMASRLQLAGRSVYVAATVEDMDFLGAGLVEAISRHGADVHVACLWIHRATVRSPEPVEVAQVIQEYIDEPPQKVDHFIALKSVISNSCVIRTSIMRMLSDIAPDHIHVTSPVMLRGERRRLEAEFPEETANRFRYWVLAIDAVLDELGNTLPGVGGNVYQRLGFKDDEDKNFHMPEFIIDRIRQRRASLSPGRGG